MTTNEVQITQEMLDAAREHIERAEAHSDMIGILFLTVEHGLIAIYNPELKQALRRRFDNVHAARAYAIAKLMNREASKR